MYREIWAMLLACGAIAVARCQGTPIATEETEGAATAMAAAPLICFVGEEAPPVVGTYDVVNPFDTPAEIVVLQPSCVCTGIEGADEHVPAHGSHPLRMTVRTGNMLGFTRLETLIALRAAGEAGEADHHVSLQGAVWRGERLKIVPGALALGSEPGHARSAEVFLRARSATELEGSVATWADLPENVRIEVTADGAAREENRGLWERRWTVKLTVTDTRVGRESMDVQRANCIARLGSSTLARPFYISMRGSAREASRARVGAATGAN